MMYDYHAMFPLFDVPRLAQSEEVSKAILLLLLLVQCFVL
jgi:hypothetical protein